MVFECSICKKYFEIEINFINHNKSIKHYYNTKLDEKDQQIKQLICILQSLHPEKSKKEKNEKEEEEIEREKVQKKIKKEQMIKQIEKEERTKFQKKDAFDRIQKLKITIESLSDNDIMEMIKDTDQNPYVEMWKSSVRTHILCKGMDELPPLSDPLWMKEFI